MVEFERIMGLRRYRKFKKYRARKMGWQPRFMGISGTADPFILELAREAADYGKPMKGILVNYPFDGDTAGAAEYRRDLTRYQPKARPGTFGFWGYGFARILIEGLRRIEGEPTREKLIAALESFKDAETGVFPPLNWDGESRRGSQGGMVVVKKGDKVRVKQVLGKVYTDGDTRSTILHIEIWKELTKQNPEEWLSGNVR